MFHFFGPTYNTLVYLFQLRIMIIEAIGSMSQIIDYEQLLEQIPKLFAMITNLYQRHNSEAFHITQVYTYL